MGRLSIVCMKNPLLIGLVFWFACGVAIAEEAGSAAGEGDIPPPPLVESEELEPEVTIIQKERETVYEYRINGAVYMVKIKPKAGPAYYLLDLDGDGEMDTQQDDPAKIVVPHWVLLRW